MNKLRLLDEFLTTLPSIKEDVPRLRVVKRSSELNRAINARIVLQVGEQTITLLIAVKNIVYPRDVQQILWRTRNLMPEWVEATKKRKEMLFLVAQLISPGAREMLRDERVGYYDSSGSVYLSANGIYVYIDKPAMKSLTNFNRFLYRGRRAQVLHTLLMWDREWFGVKELSHRSKVSHATASQVLKELEKFDWVVSRGRGPRKERHLQKPSNLLDAWVDQLPTMRPLSLKRYFVPLVRVDGLMEKLAHACTLSKIKYAVTHEAAAQLYAPFLTNVFQVRCWIEDGSATDGVLDSLDARRVDRGSNLVINEIISPGKFLFNEFVNDIRLASPVQVYLDLMRSGGRSREMAANLRKEKIGF